MTLKTCFSRFILNYQVLKQTEGRAVICSCRCLSTSPPLLKRASPAGRKPFSTSPAINYDFESDPDTTVLSNVSRELSERSPGRLFAIVHFTGKQRKVTVEDIVLFDRPEECTIGDRIRLNKVMLVGAKDFTLVGRPILSPELVKVEGTIIEKTLSQTIINSWFKPGYKRKMYLQKIPYTYLRIDNIAINPDKLPKS